MDKLIRFRDAFNELTGNRPFPWQEDLYMRWLSQGKFPSSCNLPTGLGKTSVVAIWLIALANHPEKMPRRLVYVVNRRTVVDQTTEEVLNYRRRIAELNDKDLLQRQLGSLAISTLRGQFADNREWSANPSRPAVIVGTVDMIGSRLLFSGYGVGFKRTSAISGCTDATPGTGSGKNRTLTADDTITCTRRRNWTTCLRTSRRLPRGRRRRLRCSTTARTPKRFPMPCS
jgi:CRISPR-associated helicase Cas3